MLKYAGTFSETSREQLRSLVLHLNQIFKGTAWEAVAATIVEEALVEVKPSTMVAGDYVITKHVTTEVNGVNQGRTGIQISRP